MSKIAKADDRYLWTLPIKFVLMSIFFERDGDGPKGLCEKESAELCLCKSACKAV